MRSQKGITMITLIVYIIALTLTLGILATISTDFFKNREELDNNTRYVGEMDKFAMYFVKDTKNNTYATVLEENTKVVFEDGTTYTYIKDKGEIYRNKVKICTNIAYCLFQYSTVEIAGVDKNIVTVSLMPDGARFIRSSIDYVLKYW